MTYEQLLEQKKTRVIESGFDVADADINPQLFDFQRYCVRRMLKLGRGGGVCGLRPR